MGDFNLKIWLRKLGEGLVVVVSSTGLTYIAQEIEVTELPPEYALYGSFLAMLCYQTGNFIKHAFYKE